MMNIEKIKETAFEISGPIEINWPQKQQQEFLNPVRIGFEMTYNHNNGIIAFVSENRTMYVIPMMAGMEKTLKEAGYQKKNFCVPFSNMDEPIYDNWKWQAILKWSQKAAC